MLSKSQLLLEELENVTGGNRDELALDTQLFNAMGGRCKAYTLEELTESNYRGVAAKVDNLWSQFGITVEYNDTGASQYFIGKQSITRNQAVVEVLNRAGYHNINPKHFQI